MFPLDLIACFALASGAQYHLDLCFLDLIKRVSWIAWPLTSELKCRSCSSLQTSTFKASTGRKISARAVGKGRWTALQALVLKGLAFNPPISSNAPAAGIWDKGNRLVLVMLRKPRSSSGFVSTATPRADKQGTHRDGGKKWRRALSLLDKLPRQRGAQIGDALSVVNFDLPPEFWDEPLFQLMQLGKAGVRPPLGLFNAALSTSYWQRCLSLLRIMYQVDVRPDVLSFNSAISACGVGSQPKLALQLLEKMRRCDINPETSTYIAAAEACAKNQQSQQIVNLIQDMIRDEVQLHPSMFDITISSMADQGHWQRCVSLLSLMQDVSLRPTIFGYNMAMDACRSAAKSNNILQLYDDVCSIGLVPDRYMFNLALEACKLMALPQPAIFVFQQMKEFGVSPNAFSYGCLMTQADSERTLSYIDEMHQNSISMNAYCYRSAIRACHEMSDDSPDQRYEHILLYLDKMHHNNMNINAYCYRTAIRACREMSDDDTAQRLEEEWNEQTLELFRHGN